MRGCESGWWSWRGRSRASAIGVCTFAATQRRSGEPQAGASGVSGGGVEDSAEEAQALHAHRAAAASLHGGESGVGAGLRARCGGKRASDPGAERGGCVYAGMSGAGSGHQLCQPASDAGVGGDRGGTRSAAGDSLRQRAGADEPAFSGVVHRAEDRVGAHPTGTADAERTRGKFSRAVARGVLERELVRESVRGAGEDRGVAARSTTKSGRTAVWDTGRRRNLRAKSAAKRAVEKALRGKVKATFPLRLEIPQKARDSHFPTAPAATVHPPASRLTVRMSYYDVCGDWGAGQITVRPDGVVDSVVVSSGHPLLKESAVTSARQSQFECRGCTEQFNKYRLVYTFNIEGECECEPRESPSIKNEPQQAYPQFPDAQHRVTVVAQVFCICDPAATFRVRSVKCLYLWRCGSNN